VQVDTTDAIAEFKQLLQGLGGAKGGKEGGGGGLMSQLQLGEFAEVDDQRMPPCGRFLPSRTVCRASITRHDRS
jgi:hypothetical protein